MQYNFAQFNVAWLKEALEHPASADFKNAIDPLHDIADAQEGFVWRLVAEGDESATALRPLGSDGIINCTVWESKESMAEWVYKTDHAAALKRKSDWFYAPLEPNVVMWWIPANETPTLHEAIRRLEYLRSYGATPLAFRFKDKFTPEDAQSYLTDKDNPPLDISNITQELAEKRVDGYIQAWNTNDSDERKKLLSQLTTDNVVYLDPNAACQDRASLNKYILAVKDQFANGELVRTSEVDVHNYTCRFKWQMHLPEGKSLPACLDFLTFTIDGRISNICGFFGELKEI